MPICSAAFKSVRLRSIQMIVTLERNGFIQRPPGDARSIQVLVAPKDLPIKDLSIKDLPIKKTAKPGLAQNQLVIITVSR
jgi:hypothetical protein